MHLTWVKKGFKDVKLKTGIVFVSYKGIQKLAAIVVVLIQFYIRFYYKLVGKDDYEQEKISNISVGVHCNG